MKMEWNRFHENGPGYLVLLSPSYAHRGQRRLSESDTSSCVVGVRARAGPYWGERRRRRARA